MLLAALFKVVRFGYFDQQARDLADKNYDLRNSIPPLGCRTNVKRNGHFIFFLYPFLVVTKKGREGYADSTGPSSHCLYSDCGLSNRELFLIHTIEMIN